MFIVKAPEAQLLQREYMLLCSITVVGTETVATPSAIESLHGQQAGCSCMLILTAQPAGASLG
jgi:hypothetical protein